MRKYDIYLKNEYSKKSNQKELEKIISDFGIRKSLESLDLKNKPKNPVIIALVNSPDIDARKLFEALSHNIPALYLRYQPRGEKNSTSKHNSLTAATYTNINRARRIIYDFFYKLESKREYYEDLFNQKICH